MINFIKKGINLYIYGNFHIALCSVLLYLFSVERWGIPTDNVYGIFIFMSTLFTYSIHRIIGIRKVEKYAHKGRFAVIATYRNHIKTYAILSGMVCILAFIRLDSFYWYVLIVPAAISILYTLPIFYGGRRLRDFSMIKIFLIAIVWAAVTETIPLYRQGIDLAHIGFLFIERVLFFIAITIPFDVRDYQVDQDHNVKTIPMLIGVENALRLSVFMLLIAIGIEVYLLEIAIDGIYPLACIVVYGITILLLWFTRNKKHDYYYSGLLDGTIMLPYIISETMIFFM